MVSTQHQSSDLNQAKQSKAKGALQNPLETVIWDNAFNARLGHSTYSFEKHITYISLTATVQSLQQTLLVNYSAFHFSRFNSLQGSKSYRQATASVALCLCHVTKWLHRTNFGSLTVAKYRRFDSALSRFWKKTLKNSLIIAPPTQKMKEKVVTMRTKKI